ncbi:alcohol oxidase [Fomitopsis serialis]|uniref:alcohol oxidase n=1 Tax=Fomitopsis serialis TaxID=139415 RepID=UPI002008A949|nr:alcohol oxidase [Neoantrodia serialis]KAH9918276.1 alcohol oxidase [Neoantrodia serialis]
MLANITQVEHKTFDYIVIEIVRLMLYQAEDNRTLQTAGLVVASRLSEDASVSVLVLEAGEANLDDRAILLPGQGMVHINNPKYDWGFKTVKQEHSNGREYSWPRGMGLGGSSAINFLLWNKPAREFLDAFEELGNEGWNWESFDKYSKRAEQFTAPDHDRDYLTYDLKHRGTSGMSHPCPVPVSFPTTISQLERRFIEAMQTFGIERIREASSGSTNGTSVTASTLDPKTHLRSYAANSYYAPNAARHNLTVLVSAHVASIVTRRNAEGTLTATGVYFIHGGSNHVVHASKEVCLSAGTIMSPQILELSGIGDHHVLNQAGVEVKCELPGVGANVQEHLWSGVIYRVKDFVVDGRPVTTMDPLMNPAEAPKHIALHASGKGALNVWTTSLTFLPLNSVCVDADKLQRTLSDTILDGIKKNVYNSGLRKQYELQLKHIRDHVPSLEIMLLPRPIVRPEKPDVNQKHITLGLALNSPFSRGTIHIGSSDPLKHPLIDPNLYDEAYVRIDIQSMVELVKFNRQLAQTPPFKETLAEEVMPGPTVQSDEQIANWLRNVVNTTYHTTGSCSMLPLEDGGVVDAKLRVYHTTNIRVVDLSIVPLNVGSHTQALTYAIGEQAADIIKGVI